MKEIITKIIQSLDKDDLDKLVQCEHKCRECHYEGGCDLQSKFIGLGIGKVTMTEKED